MISCLYCKKNYHGLCLDMSNTVVQKMKDDNEYYFCDLFCKTNLMAEDPVMKDKLQKIDDEKLKKQLKDMASLQQRHDQLEADKNKLSLELEAGKSKYSTLAQAVRAQQEATATIASLVGGTV